MPDIEHKIHYRGVNWNKVHKRQEQRWAAKAGEVTIISPADPDKLKEFKEERQAKGLNLSKSKKKKKLTKKQRKAKRLAKQQLGNAKKVEKSFAKNKAILDAATRATPSGFSRPTYDQPIIGPDPIGKPPYVANRNKKKQKVSKSTLTSGPRKRSTGDKFGGLPVVKKEKENE